MAIEDLDLEFEDEEVEKNDALEVDVDLSFSASADSAKQAPANKKVVGKDTNLSADDATDPNLVLPKAIKPAAKAAPAKAQAKPTQTPKAQARPQAKPGNVANIADHKKSAPQPQAAVQAKPTQQQVPSPVQAPAGLEDYQYELDSLRNEIENLRSEIQNVQKHADVQVAVAEAKTEFMIEYITNAKLLDHQVNQVLQRIHKKVPQLKNEVLTVKKYMSEFIDKNGKKK